MHYKSIDTVIIQLIIFVKHLPDNDTVSNVRNNIRFRQIMFCLIVHACLIQMIFFFKFQLTAKSEKQNYVAQQIQDD